MKRICFLILVTLLLFCSCDTSKVNITDESSVQDEISFDQSDNMFTDKDNDSEYNESSSVRITLNNDSIECDSSDVKINGKTVTITKENTYIITGNLDDGMIIVNADKNAKPKIVFAGVSINSNSSAPIYIKEADKVFITLATNTENTLSNSGVFIAIDENDIDSVVFSKQDLTFNGSGKLFISSPTGHGIVSKDDLVFTGGVYNITSAYHAIDANDSVRITNSTFKLDAGKDGIHSENNDDSSLGFVFISGGDFNIESEGDGISASSDLQIISGNFDILTGGGSINASRPSSDGWGEPGGRPGGPGGRPGGRSSTENTVAEDSSTSIKAIKASNNLLVEGGTFTIDSADDSVHSNSCIIINGGTFDISAGDDAFHADEILSINNGSINITDSYEGLEALNIIISGGTIRIISADDGINAAGGNDSSGMGGMRPGGDRFGASNGSIVISGGTIYMNASGDGIDANGTLEISGGHITVCGPTKGDTAVLDYDKTAVITGGTFVGTGASMMAQTISSSNQGVIALSVGNQKAGTLVTVTDKQGNELITVEPVLSFQIVIISTPEIKKGDEYTVTVGTLSDIFQAE